MIFDSAFVAAATAAISGGDVYGVGLALPRIYSLSEGHNRYK